MNGMIRGPFALSALLLLTAAIPSVPPNAISGELIDTYCYAKVGVRGAPHAACALKCVRAGIAAGLLESKTRRVYVLLPSADATALPPALVAQMGHEVEISGDVIAKGGTNFLTVRSFRLTR